MPFLKVLYKFQTLLSFSIAFPITAAKGALLSFI